MSDNKRGWDRYAAEQQQGGDYRLFHGNDYKRERRDATPGSSSYDYSGSSRHDVQQFSSSGSSSSSTTLGNRPNSGGYPPSHQPSFSSAGYDDRDRGHRVPSPYGGVPPSGPPLANRQSSYPRSVERDRGRERGRGGGGYDSGASSTRVYSLYPSYLPAQLLSNRAYSGRAATAHAPWAGMASLGLPHHDRDRYQHDPSVAPSSNRRESWRDEWRAERGLKGNDPLSKPRSSAAGGASSYSSLRSSKRIFPRKFGSERSSNFSGSNSFSGVSSGADSYSEKYRYRGAQAGSEPVLDDEVLDLMRTSELVVDTHVINCLLGLDVDMFPELMEAVFNSR